MFYRKKQGCTEKVEKKQQVAKDILLPTRRSQCISDSTHVVQQDNTIDHENHNISPYLQEYL